jgi:hypothetical protein
MPAEVVGPAVVLRSVARLSGAILLAAVAAAGIAYALGVARTDTWESTAKIAFIEDTRFDYVDAERDRLIGHIEDQVNEHRSSPDVAEIRFDRPSRETFFDVIVRTTDPDGSADLANELAEAIVESDRSIRMEPIDREISARRAQLVVLEDQITELEDEMESERTREAFAEANRYEGDAEQLEELTIELRQAQDATFLAARFRNRLDIDRSENEQRLLELEIDRAIVEAEVRVVRPALVPKEDVGPGAWTLALIAGAATVALGAVMAALIAPSRSRSSGSHSSSDVPDG